MTPEEVLEMLRNGQLDPAEVQAEIERTKFQAQLKSDIPSAQVQTASVLPSVLQSMFAQTDAIAPVAPPEMDRTKAQANYVPANRSANLDKMVQGNPIEDRANAFNREHNHNGLQAGVDTTKDGRKILSISGQGTAGVVPIYGSGQEGVVGSVRDIIGKLRTTTDPDAARSLQSQLNEAAAMESARIQSEARTHAENKIGVPTLETALSKSIELDRNSPGWYPGRGDSQNTQQVRASLNTARSAADMEAARNLKSNVTANALDAALKTAQMETARISRLADKMETNDLNVMNRKIIKEDNLNAKLDQMAEGLTDPIKQNIRILNPVLANASDRELVANVDKSKGNTSYLMAIQANDADLPKLAAEGNKFSTAIVQAREEALGISRDATDANIRTVNDIMRSPAKLKEAMKFMTPKTEVEQRALQASLGDIEGKSRGSKEDQALALENKYRVARDFVAAKKTTAYVENVESWGSPDPLLQAAITEAKTVGGGAATIDAVTAAYVGKSIGPERAAKVENLIRLMEGSASKQKDSLFGMPNTMMVRNKIMQYQLEAMKRQQSGYSGSGGLHDNTFGNL